MASYSHIIALQHALLLWASLALLQTGSVLAAANITILPLNPSPTDSLNLTVSDNDNPDSCVPESLEAIVTGNDIQLTGILPDTGQVTFCLNAITPYSVIAELGPLAAGDYVVEFRLEGETVLAAETSFTITDDDSTPPPSDEPISTSVWIDEIQSGQGFFVWIQDEQMVTTWYLYDELGQGTWVRIESSLSSFDSLSLTQPLTSGDTTVGAAAVVLLAEDMAQFNYTFNAAQGSLLLSPLPMECASTNNPIYPQAWSDPVPLETRVHLLQQGDCLLGVWSFVEGSRFRWLLFRGTLSTTGVLNTSLTEFTGPPLGTPWDTSLLVEQSVGTVSLAIDQQTLTFRPTLAGESTTQLNLEPFAP